MYAVTLQVCQIALVVKWVARFWGIICPKYSCHNLKAISIIQMDRPAATVGEEKKYMTQAFYRQSDPYFFFSA